VLYFGYRKTLSGCYLSNTDVPPKKTWKCEAQKIFSASGKSVIPLTPNKCVDRNILHGSNELVKRHTLRATYHGKLRKQVGNIFSCRFECANQSHVRLFIHQL